jgi:hypothetical protein
MTVDEIVAEHKEKASQYLMADLEPAGAKFHQVLDRLLEAYMRRETTVKDICVELAIAYFRRRRGTCPVDLVRRTDQSSSSARRNGGAPSARMRHQRPALPGRVDTPA